MSFNIQPAEDNSIPRQGGRSRRNPELYDAIEKAYDAGTAFWVDVPEDRTLESLRTTVANAARALGYGTDIYQDHDNNRIKVRVRDSRPRRTPVTE